MLCMTLATSCVDMDIAPKNIVTSESLLSNESGMDIYMARMYSNMPWEDFKYMAQWGLNFSGWLNAIGIEGTGEAIGRTGSAVVKYKGQLIDGTVFDSNDEGATLSPRGTVPGFAEGLAMMKKGAKYVLYIPGELAYGVDGQPQAGIGPNATLVFEVEAVEVTPGK